MVSFGIQSWALSLELSSRSLISRCFVNSIGYWGCALRLMRRSWRHVGATRVSGRNVLGSSGGRLSMFAKQATRIASGKAAWVRGGSPSEFQRCSRRWPVVQADRLDEWMFAMPAAEGGAFLRRLQLMRSRIIETLQSKLVFLWHIPYGAIGIVWCECGGVLGVCQQITRYCIAEYDEAVTLGREVHRVAHRLFAIGTRCRADLDAWVGTSQPLKHLFMHTQRCWSMHCALLWRDVLRLSML